MQKHLFYSQIKEKLNFLKENLPKQPTAVKEPYLLPDHLVDEVIENGYSRSSLQKISDHIGAYLGLSRSVKITIIEQSGDNQFVGSSDGVVVANDTRKSPSIGLYKSIGLDRGEIILIKNPKFKFKHMLAILAHEYIHNYLFHHNIRESQETANEILTEIAAAFLGLGHLLIPGYETISWTEGFTEYSVSIGYVTPDTIRKAIIISAELRGWSPEEVVARFSSVLDKIVAYVQLWPYRVKSKQMMKAKQRSDSQISSLRKNADEINNIHNQVRKLVKNITATKPSSISREDGPMLVEITNKISVGEIELEIQGISKNLDDSKIICLSDTDITQLVKQVNDLKNTLTCWRKVLCKYSSD